MKEHGILNLFIKGAKQLKTAVDEKYLHSVRIASYKFFGGRRIKKNEKLPKM